MNLSITVKTSIPDLVVDFLEVELGSGKTASINWDESGISRCSDGFSATYKGLCFNEDSAQGRLHELLSLNIIGAGVYCEQKDITEILLKNIVFEEAGTRLLLPNTKVKISDFT